MASRRRLGIRIAALAALAAIVAAISPAPAHAQAARVWRLPVLAAPASDRGNCRSDPVKGALRRAGVTRMVSYRLDESSGHRLVSLAVNAKGATVMLMAMAGTTEGRRGESESVTVMFTPDGKITNGRRTAFTTGTAVHKTDDQTLGLLPGDTVAIRGLDAALRRRCRI